MASHEKGSQGANGQEHVHHGPKFPHRDGSSDNRVGLPYGATDSPEGWRKSGVGKSPFTEIQIGRTDNGAVVLFPNVLPIDNGDILGYLTGAYNQSVVELREGENRGFRYVGFTLGNRTQDIHTETRPPEEIPAEEREAYQAEMGRIQTRFGEFASTRPVIVDEGNRATYQQVYMGDYPILSDDGEMVHRPIVVVPSIDGKPGPTAQYNLAVYIRDPKATEPPNMFDADDRLVFSISLDCFLHPALIPTLGYVKGFGGLMDQVVERNKITIIQGEIE